MNDCIIRPARPADQAAAYYVCLKTGDFGKDGEPFYREDPDALGRIFVGPYLAYEPELSLILEDAQGVCGYALGAFDSRAFYARYEKEWRPDLCRRFAVPHRLQFGEELVNKNGLFAARPGGDHSDACGGFSRGRTPAAARRDHVNGRIAHERAQEIRAVIEAKRREFLEAQVIPERIKHRIEPEQCGSQRDDCCRQRAFVGNRQ